MRWRGNRFYWLLAGVAALSAAWPQSLRADEALEEITVTAQRVTERLQDVPVAVTAISASELLKRGVRQAGDITASVPNLLLNSPYGPEAQPTFTLRGVTTQDFSQNQSSPVAMYVDEVYKSVGAVQALQTYDLDRVEVLRGPQGTLYGKNATGGAISFYTKNPSLTAYDGYITAGAGNYSAYSVRGAVGGPVIDNDPSLTLSNDPNFSLSTGNIGWFDNGAKFAVHKDIRSDNATLKIDWQLSPHATLTSVTDYGWWYEKSDDGGLPIFVRLDDPNTYFSSVNTFSQEIRIASHDTGAFGWLGGLYYGRESTHATVQFHFFDGYPSFFAPSVPPTSASVPTPLWGFDEYNNFDQLKDSRAVFFNATYTVAPTVTLRWGLRYTKDKVTISHFYALEGGLANPGATTAAGGTDPNIDATTWWTQTVGNPALYPPPPPNTPPTAPRLYFQQGLAVQGFGFVPTFGNDTNNVSGKVGVDWKASEGVLAYLSISRGYRGVAFNGQAYNDNTELTFAEPEKLTSYELGLKTELWERRAVFNAAAFHYDYKNQQFLDAFTLPGGLGTGFRTVNAPKSRVDGAEFEFRAKATNDLEILASVGLLHSKYVELVLHGVDRAGNRLIQAPNFNGSLGVDWRFAHLAAGDLRLFVDGNYYGKQYFDAFNTERIAQDAYGIANARVSFESSGRRGFTVAAWVKNLTNRQYLAYGLNQKDPDTGALGFDYGLVGEPRTYGAEATLRF